MSAVERTRGRNPHRAGYGLEVKQDNLEMLAIAGRNPHRAGYGLEGQKYTFYRILFVCRNPHRAGYGLEDYGKIGMGIRAAVAILIVLDMGWKRGTFSCVLH